MNTVTRGSVVERNDETRSAHLDRILKLLSGNAAQGAQEKAKFVTCSRQGGVSAKRPASPGPVNPIDEVAPIRLADGLPPQLDKTLDSAKSLEEYDIIKLIEKIEKCSLRLALLIILLCGLFHVLKAEITRLFTEVPVQETQREQAVSIQHAVNDNAILNRGWPTRPAPQIRAHL